MNTQFHTPSFGDEFVDVQQQQLQSKRVRGMDSSLDEYHSANDESFGNTAMSLNCSPSAMMTAPTTTLAARKQLATTATDPNEPAKPLSAYALFFRDTVSAIKQQNPNCSFQELSRIVASMWEALDPMHKNIYQKKNEAARTEYLKQLRVYRQQQLEQQQMSLTIDEHSNNNQTLQSRPAVFTIARTNSSDNAATTAVNMLNSYVSPMLTSPQQQQTPITATTQYLETQQQQQFNVSQQQQQMLNVHTHQEQISNNVNTPTVATSVPVTHTSADPSPQQMQMLTEAGSVQKCTRENCNKRAIINPDWEDEYCSNECVVIHCRNVFNAWVQTNLEAHKQ